jgi:hypothetical protein
MILSFDENVMNLEEDPHHLILKSTIESVLKKRSPSNLLKGDMPHFQTFQRRQHLLPDRYDRVPKLFRLRRRHVLLLSLPPNRHEIHHRLPRGTLRMIECCRSLDMSHRPRLCFDVVWRQLLEQRAPEANQVVVPLSMLVGLNLAGDRQGDEFSHRVLGQGRGAGNGRVERHEKADHLGAIVAVVLVSINERLEAIHRYAVGRIGPFFNYKSSAITSQ